MKEKSSKKSLDMKENNAITDSLNNQFKDFFVEVADMSLNELAELFLKDNEAINKLLVVNLLSTANDIRSSLQSYFFIKKYAKFIGRIHNSSLTQKEIRKSIEIYSSEKNLRELCDNTILTIDRFQREIKAEILAELFIQTFKNYNFSVEEYNGLMFSIEMMHPYNGIETLKAFYDYKQQMIKASSDDEKRRIWGEGSKLEYHPLLMTGLLILPTGRASAGNLGGAFLNDLGKKFYEYVVIKFV